MGSDISSPVYRQRSRKIPDNPAYDISSMDNKSIIRQRLFLGICFRHSPL